MYSGIYRRAVERIAKNGGHAEAIRIKADRTESINRSARMVYGWLTRTCLDVDGEVICADGVDMETYFPTNVRAVYFNHDVEEGPVGSARRVFRKGDGWRLETFILPTPFGDDLLTMIEHGAVGHYSIGGRIMQYGPPTQDELKKYGAGCDGVIRKMICQEGSLVSMPALPGAALDEVVDESKTATLDRMLTKSLISRRSAVRAGLPTTETVQMFGGLEIPEAFEI